MVEDLESSRLDRKGPSQNSNAYDRSVSFQVQSVGMYGLSGVCVQVLNHDRPGSASRQEGYSIEQDRKCV